MSAKHIASASYKKLISSVSSALSSGLLAAQKALEYQRLKTYWEIGRRIRQAVERSGGAIVLGERLYEDISRDIQKELKLDLSADLIGRAVRFSKIYPVFPAKTPLTFTHYLALMRVADSQKRGELEKKAIAEDISSGDLKAEIFKFKPPERALSKAGAFVLQVKRGEPYVYCVRPAEDIQGNRTMSVDCGFKIHLPVKGAFIGHAPAFPGYKTRYVRTVRKQDRYDIRLAIRKRDLIYTYAARILKVVDGDTLDVRIDVGFGIHLNARLRLKGIDAPEMSTQEGKIAAKFVEKQLAKCPVVVIRTQKAGMYGRWLADVFVLPKSTDVFQIAAEGTCLNQLLIDKGLAKPYSS